jgi:glutathione S-transferase
MLKLYFSKGSSALAAHILLEEVGAVYETEEISIPKGQHQTPEFLAVNSKGRVPVLDTPDGSLTESPAILEYIAATHPDAGMIPDGAFDQARARSLCAYICATAHVAFAHKQRGIRWADSPQAIEAMAARVPRNLAESAAFLESQLREGPWAMGQSYSFCDPYLFLMGRWLAATEHGLTPYPNLSAHSIAIKNRPAAQAAFEQQGLS